MAFLFDPRFQAVSALGLPMAGATLAFYRAGTTSKINVWQNSQATVQHTNPVVADASGTFPPIFITSASSYKIVLKNVLGITVQTVDRIPVGEVVDLEALGQAVDDAIIYRDQTQAIADQAQIDIADSRGSALTAISNSRAATLADISAGRTGALNDIETARVGALADVDELVDEAEAARDIAAGYASDLGSAVNPQIYATLLGALSKPGGVGLGINAFRANGYYAAGDGGAALWVEASVQSSGPGKRQDAAGKWFQLAERRWHMKMLGAKGDGVADDYAPVREAITSGKPLDWGSGLTYRTATAISEVLSSAIDWTSDASMIVYDGSSTRTAVYLLVPAGQTTITGRLTIDAAEKAFIGWFIETLSVSATIEALGLRSLNIFRASTAFTGGDGIWVRGPWAKCVLEDCGGKGFRMASGAGVSGSQGVSGITVSGNAQGDPIDILVVNPDIEKVYCDDPAYTFDQDGLKIIVSPPASLPQSARTVIRGGRFKNCYGRSIKAQGENTLVDGPRFIRTEGFARGYGNQEIDFQEGGGRAVNIDCEYAGSAPSVVCQFSSTRQNSKAVTPGELVSADIRIAAGTTLQAVIYAQPFANITRQITRGRGINVVGDLTNFALFNAANAGEDFSMLLESVTAGPSGPWVVCGSSAGKGFLSGVGLIHTGSTAGKFRSATSGNFRPAISLDKSLGFAIEKSMANSATETSGFTAVDAIVPKTLDGTTTGILRPLPGFTLADGATKQLPYSGVNGSTGILIISVGAGRADQGIFAVDNSAVAILAAGASFGVGSGASEPATGSFRVWNNGANLGPAISNRSGTSRTVTCWMLG